MNKQGYNSRLDESLGARNGKKSQSYKARRDESKGMMKRFGKHPYSADSNMKEWLQKVEQKTTSLKLKKRMKESLPIG